MGLDGSLTTAALELAGQLLSKTMRTVVKLAASIDLSFRVFGSRILRNRLLRSCKRDNRESSLH